MHKTSETLGSFTLPAGRSRKPTFPEFVGKKSFQVSREPTNSAGNLLKRRFPASAGRKCEPYHCGDVVQCVEANIEGIYLGLHP